jgi:bla regulator protein BlaR1
MSALVSLEAFCFWLWQASWQASIVVGLVILTQWLLGDRLHPRWRFALWFLVVIRLGLPISPSSSFSVFNLTDRLSPFSPRAMLSVRIPEDILSQQAPARSLEISEAGPSQAAPPASALTARPRPTEPVRAQQGTLSKLLCGFWLAGVLVTVSLLGLESIVQFRRIRRASPVTDPMVTALLKEVCETLRWSRPPDLLQSPGLGSPALFGFWRMRLLLPDGLLEVFSPQQIRHIFLHEIAHLKRRDPELNWILLGL